MENIINPKQFLHKAQIGKAKVSELLPILKHIATEWNLQLNKACDFKTAKRILINSVTNN